MLDGLKLASHHIWSKATLGKDLEVDDMARCNGRVDALTVEDGVKIKAFVCLTIEAPLKIGRRCYLMQGAIITAHKPVTICAGAKIGQHAQILAGVHIGDGFRVGPIMIGTGAVIGPGAIIGPGTIIPQNGQIAANSVIGIDLDVGPASRRAAE